MPFRTADPIFRLILSLLVFSLALVAAASRPFADPRTVELNEVESGTLLIKTETPGRYLAAPTVKTDVRMEVSGLVARVTVSQQFTNPSKKWIEGVYVFPLPENAAVDRLRMRIGDRFIEGKVKEREAARKLYLEALKAGKKAALTEQERPNIFTNSVANIGPGETVLVQIEYQHTLRYDRGAFSLRFPMVVGPRYIPSGERVVAFKGTGWGANTVRVPDANRITPPVRHPSRGKVNPVSLHVTLKPGFPIEWIKSATHKIKVTDNADGGKTIVFDETAVFAEKDLVISWLPKTGSAPGAGLFTETIGGKTYALLMVMPPNAKAGDIAAIKRLPREVVFVIDTSGSMSGTSIKQARAALLLALDRLKPGDTFNVVEFNSNAYSLFPDAQYASPAMIAQAKSYVRNLKARGGTEMLKALNMVLDGRKLENRLRQVIFLTDGSVGNEAQLFRFIKANLGDTRLFTVGIGSAPNSHFMTKAAQYGRGTFTYVSRVADTKAKMTALFRKIEEPVLTDIRVTFAKEAGAEAWPRKVADLYRGEPVIVAVELKKLAGKVTIEGRFAGKPWKLALPLTGGQAGKGMGTLWARAKIAALMDSLREGADHKEVRGQVIAVALKHHLVSKFTSLVAIDVTPSRPSAEGVSTEAVAVNLPAGWNFEKVFGKQTGQRTGKDGTRRADKAVTPSVIDTEKKEADLRALGGRLAKSKVSSFSSVGHRVRRAFVAGLPKPAADAAKAPQPATGSANKPITVKPGKVREHLAQEARPSGGKADAKVPVQAGAKAPTQLADATAEAARKKGQRAAVSRDRRDLYASLALLVLVLAGVMVWLKRNRIA
ncbi:MAG: marine proteobacterial sortase target protein [Alphaproteobacteria bacterium]